MKRTRAATTGLMVTWAMALGLVCKAPAEEGTKPFEHFVTAEGGQLMDGDRELRFISFNIPNLNYVEDEFAFDRTHPYRLPDEFEIRDAFESVRQLGGQVVRLYTIPVRRGQDPDDVPTYVVGPGRLDETSMQTMDRVLALANEQGVRLIVPLLNSWPWMGGVPQYAAFRGREEHEFWTDRQLIDDFKRIVESVVTRTNTISGVAYRDDKAILCWETGNELFAPHAWTHEIAAHIKELDPNHLVMDGYYAIDPIPVREEAVADPLIDIVSSHHYVPDPDLLRAFVRTNLEVIGGRKPYVLGEFGFVGTSAVERILDDLVDSGISGALIWSLRFHRREGGFYWHSEPLGSGLFKAYHWPGFASGGDYDERRVRARNLAGVSSPSNVVGPVAVPHATFVDNMRSRAIPYRATGDVTVATNDDRRFRERMSRRQAPNGSEIVYALPGRLTGFRVQVFAQETDDPIVVLGSPDGRTFGPLPVRRESFALGDEDYGYWVPTLYSGEGREDDRYLKIVFRNPAQLSRVEIRHAPRGAGDAPAGTESRVE